MLHYQQYNQLLYCIVYIQYFECPRFYCIKCILLLNIHKINIHLVYLELTSRFFHKNIIITKFELWQLYINQYLYLNNNLVNILSITPQYYIFRNMALYCPSNNQNMFVLYHDINTLFSMKNIFYYLKVHMLDILTYNHHKSHNFMLLHIFMFDQFH